MLSNDLIFISLTKRTHELVKLDAAPSKFDQISYWYIYTKLQPINLQTWTWDGAGSLVSPYVQYWLSSVTPVALSFPLDFHAERILPLPASLRLSVRPSVNCIPCPLDNSSQIWAGITKIAPKMYLGILSVAIENGGHWPWSSRSFWPFWLIILGNLACPRYNLATIPTFVYQTCILGYLVLKMGIIDRDLQDHVGHFVL